MFRLPKNTQRVSVIGRTGSGKTVFGAWLLSHAPFDRMPYVMIDYKGDELLNGIGDRVREITLKEIPKHPGLYIVHPRPSTDNDAIEEWMYRIWDKTRIGLYIDEAYMIPDKGAFQGILTQGRALRIPVICLTQRPAWISRFVFSESDFYAVFHLNDKDDRLKVHRFVPADLSVRLKDFHSHWYDVGNDASMILTPVPKPEVIQEKIYDRLQVNKRFL